MTDRTVTASTTSPTTSGRKLGMPVVVLAALALLAVPRIVLHDLGLIAPGTMINSLLVFLPPAIWVAVVLLRRVPSPFLTLLVVGVFHGIVLALTHQLLWSHSFAGGSPRLGGNLADLDAGVQEVVIRSFAVGSSLVTGIVVGVIAGLVAWGLRSLARRVRAS